MWNETESEFVHVGSLAELDELIAERVMARVPEIYWEESYARLRFESVHEALEAMRDPYYQLFIPEKERAGDVLSEVRLFPPYSAEIETAMEVVERLSAEGEPLRLQKESGRWVAAFGWNPDARAATAPEAICLAALRVKGIRAELDEQEDEHETGLSH